MWLSHTSYAVSLIHFGLLSNFKRNFLLWLQYLKLYRIFKVQRKNYLTSCTHRSLASIVFVQSFLITKSFLILFHPEHTRLSYPLPSPGTCSNSCPLSWWCHPTISSSVVPFSSLLQSCPASGSFLINQLFASSDQSVGASASASVLLMNVQNWFSLGLTVLISMQFGGLSRGFSFITIQIRKVQFLQCFCSITCILKLEFLKDVSNSCFYFS